MIEIITRSECVQCLNGFFYFGRICNEKMSYLMAVTSSLRFVSKAMSSEVSSVSRFFKS